MFVINFIIAFKLSSESCELGLVVEAEVFAVEEAFVSAIVIIIPESINKFYNIIS